MTPSTTPSNRPVSETRVSILGRSDVQSVDDLGHRTLGAIDGVELKAVRPYLDARGTLSELINFNDPFWREPIVYGYSITVNPGRIKGWAMHLRQTDRQYVHCGLMRFVLHDARDDSPTHGTTQTITLGDEARGIVRIPPGVWHAAQCLGDAPTHITNFPTVAYDRESPDKQMLPLDTDLIPFDFSDLDTYGR